MSATWEWLSGWVLPQWVSHEVSVRMSAGTAVSTSGWPIHRLFLIPRSHHGLQSPHDKHLVFPEMIPQYHVVHIHIFPNYLKNALKSFLSQNRSNPDSCIVSGSCIFCLEQSFHLLPCYLLCKEPRTDEFRMLHTLDLCDCFLLMEQVNDP